MKLKTNKTHRGFDNIEFTDYYGEKCSIQKSSIGDKDAIWMGVDDANPRIMASKVVKNGTGWVKYPISDDVLLTTRMHLTKKQVEQLLPILIKFIETGEIV
jgi:hypothetical protein